MHQQQILDWASIGALDDLTTIPATNILTARDKHGSTALHYAAGGGHLSMVHYLVKDIGMDANTGSLRNKRTALHWAVRNGHVDVCRCLVQDYQALVDALAVGDVTPLQLAIWQCHLKTARMLVHELGANPHYINQWGCGVAHWLGKSPRYQEDPTVATRELVLKTCRWLFEEQGVSFQGGNNHGQTPLHKAAFAGNLPVVEYLVVCCGVVDDQRDMQGNSAADCAERTEAYAIARWLRRHASPILKESLQMLQLDLIIRYPLSFDPPQPPSTDTIRRAFLKLAKEHHPDKCSNHQSNVYWSRLQQAYTLLLSWWNDPDYWDFYMQMVCRNQALMERPLLLWTEEWHQNQKEVPNKALVNEQKPRQQPTEQESTATQKELDDFEMKLIRLLRTDTYVQHGLPLAQLPKEYAKNWHQPVPKPRDYGCRKLIHLLQRHCPSVHVEFANQEKRQHAVLWATKNSPVE